jgi:hypothetical protein
MKSGRVEIPLHHCVLLALLLIFSSSPLWADTIVYEYDSAGRTKRIYTQGTIVIDGDLDHDEDVDRDDVAIIRSHRNQPASACPECDLDADGTITALDARKLVTMCTCPGCVCP